MSFFKTILKYTLILFTLVFFSGCIHKIDTNGLTLSISQEELTDSFKDSFPLKKDFGLGNIVINTPLINIPNSSNIVDTTIKFSISTILTPKEKGFIKISGVPYFNKKQSAIYLEDVKLKRVFFSKLDTNDKTAEAFLLALQPMIKEAFKKFPIYEIEKDSFQGTFVKDIKVSNQALLVTFGI